MEKIFRIKLILEEMTDLHSQLYSEVNNTTHICKGREEVVDSLEGFIKFVNNRCKEPVIKKEVKKVVKK